jgi:hypothetical protein
VCGHRLLSELVFPEPHFVEVDTESDVEIVFGDERVGVGLAAHVFKAEVNHCFVFGNGESEAQCDAIVTDVVAL